MVSYVDDNDDLYTVEANGDLDGDGTFDNQNILVDFYVDGGKYV